MTGFIQENISEVSPIVGYDFRHALCTGETGCGKTTSFMLPNIEDRMIKNYGMLIIDVKGNLHLHVKALANKHNRLKDVEEIGVPWGSDINIFANISRSLFLNTLREVNGGSKDDFWISSALNLAGQFYDILAITKNLKDIIKAPNNFKFSYDLDPKSINKILSSFESLKNFIDECEKVNKAFSIKNIAKFSKYIYENELHLITQFINEFSRIFSRIKHFYDEIDQSNPSAANGGVFFSLRSIMHSFSTHGLDGKKELKELLEAGKIVIINASTYDEKLNLSMMNILYRRLLIRNNDKPITLFIDEFQRSVSEENIPYIDLFREMKIELIAAMQNIQQLENKLTETKCSEFLGNILYNYEYANHMENSLCTFEFTHKNKKAKAKPIFLKEKEKILAQIKWQNTTKYPLMLGWIYIRADGYKRAVIQNIKTKNKKFHYILDKKDLRLLEELNLMKIAARKAA
jgi:hypothetical protein